MLQLRVRTWDDLKNFVHQRDKRPWRKWDRKKLVGGRKRSKSPENIEEELEYVTE